MTEQKRLGISDDTLDEMIKFFLKTSVPRLIEKNRKEGRSNDNRRNARMDKTLQ